MRLSRAIGNFMGQRLSNMEKSKYIQNELAKYQVTELEELPFNLQIAIQREVAYLRGLVDGIRLCNSQKDQCQMKKH